MILRFTILAATALGACIPASAQLRPRDRYAITAELVAAKLASTFADKGISLSATQITLPTAVNASEESPALEVRSIQPLVSSHGQTISGTSSAVKLACSRPKVCVPFYAVVSLPTVSRAKVQSADTPTLNTVLSRPQSAIKSGAHITMLIDSGATHIRMDVISSESGAPHQQIKVHSADRKQTYTAEVLDASTVRGTL